MKYDIKIIATQTKVYRDEWQCEPRHDALLRQQVHQIAEELLAAGAFEVTHAPHVVYDDDGRAVRIDENLVNVDVRLRIALPADE